MNTRIAAFFDATNMLSDVTSGRFIPKLIINGRP